MDNSLSWGIDNTEQDAAADIVCRVADGQLHLGSTTAPLYTGSEAVTKVCSEINF